MQFFLAVRALLFRQVADEGFDLRMQLPVIPLPIQRHRRAGLRARTVPRQHCPHHPARHHRCPLLYRMALARAELGMNGQVVRDHRGKRLGRARCERGAQRIAAARLRLQETNRGVQRDLLRAAVGQVELLRDHAHRLEAHLADQLRRLLLLLDFLLVEDPVDDAVRLCGVAVGVCYGLCRAIAGFGDLAGFVGDLDAAGADGAPAGAGGAAAAGDADAGQYVAAALRPVPELVEALMPTLLAL